MAEWAPGPDVFSDIHDASIELIRTMIPYLLEEADTRDLGLWGFIYVILVFMRSLKTRPALLGRLGPAFQAQILAPFLNMLLREDETRGGTALKSASQSDLVTVWPVPNEEKKLGNYGLHTEYNRKKYLCEQEDQRQVEHNGDTSTVRNPEEVSADDTTFKAETVTTDGVAEGVSDEVHDIDAETKTSHWEHWQTFSNPLPEHVLLFGLPFAREAEPYDKCVRDPRKDTESVSAKATPAVRTAAEKPNFQCVRGSSASVSLMLTPVPLPELDCMCQCQARASS